MQFKDIQENISLIHYCKTIYCYRMTLPSTSTTSGTPTRSTPLFKSGSIPGERSNRKNRQSVFFTAVNPIDVQLDRREVEYDLNKARIAPYKQNMEISSQYSILVQFTACSEKGIAILSNSIGRNHSFRHTTSGLYRQSGLHENKGPKLPRVSNTFRRMYMFENRENPMIVREISTGKPVSVNIVLIFESLAFHVPLSNKLRQIEKEKVRQLFEQFENHPNWNMLLKDF